MRVPPFFKDLPNEAVKRVVDLLNQPQLIQTVKEAAQQIGATTEWGASQVQDSMKQAKRWLDSVNARWQAASPPSSMPVINATGLVFSHELSVTPSDGAAHAAYAGAFAGSIDEIAVRDELEHQISKLCGASAAIVVHSPAVALQHIAMHKSFKEGILLPRQHAIRLPDGGDVMGILSRFSKAIEVGAVNSLSLDDFQLSRWSDSQLNQLAVLQIFPVDNSPTDAVNASETIADSLLRVSKEKGLASIELRYDATLCDVRHLFSASCSVKERIDAGVNLIVFPGDMLINGTRSGIIVGSKELIEPLRETVRTLGGATSCLTNLMLLGSLDACKDANSWTQTAIGEMLTSSLANELNRAKRMAAQLEAFDEIESVSVSEQILPLGNSVWSSVRTPTAVIELYPKANLESLNQRVAQCKRRLLVRHSKGVLQLVMRTIDPADDREIVSVFTSK